MGVVGIVAGVVVGLAFVWAGAAKLVVGPDWSVQAADLGVSASVARVVPVVEIVIGVPLAVHLFPPWPAAAALVVLVAYTALIVRRLLDGSRPPCACFGSRSERPLGAAHVIRNLALIALAAVAVIWG